MTYIRCENKHNNIPSRYRIHLSMKTHNIYIDNTGQQIIILPFPFVNLSSLKVEIECEDVVIPFVSLL